MAALLSRIGAEAHALRRAIQSGLIGFVPPQALPAIGTAVLAYGTMGSALSVAAARYGGHIAVRDERGELTYAELEWRSNAVANYLRALGVQPGDGVGVLVRNHRGFFDAVFGAAKCGARVILLNTDFAGPQVREVGEREDIAVLIHDEEYTRSLADVSVRLGRIPAWQDDPGDGSLEWIVARGNRARPPRPARHPKIVLLTSGTTGLPKGAQRRDPRGLAVVGGLIDRIPFRTRSTVAVCSPMFHTLGYAGAVLALEYGSTLLLRRRFDPEASWRDLHDERVDTMIVVPVMLRRLLDVERDRPPALRVVFVAGSQLGSDLATRSLRRLGPVVYNLYGSTEVSAATIATPDDLRVAPGSVGKPIRGVRVRLFDDHGNEVPTGQIGRIFVGGPDQLDEYTTGGRKQTLHGLMSTGDVGRFDDEGRLYIEGRDDDMIVSGGENVFPAEIEDLLTRHPGIVECAVVGVPDDTFGQRLRAFVVAGDPALTEDDVRAHVKANLARFKVPRDVVFLDELPRNPTGKVLNRVLVARKENER
nr:AMP-binding protein [Kibdelosporangium sp. MJ126-NF4]CEL15574.1 Long-chain fatty-acid-CoA ligase, Mycobacterial subgroup FadD2 [Kibdelosporangium sp. MJ126-NF4]